MRYWAPEEANEALGWVAERVDRIRRTFEATQGRLQRVRGNGKRAADEQPGSIREPVEELEREGIVVRDLARGLIDFPARTASGRPYWLCWVAGESEVAWWHWPEEGFAGRRPLSDPPV